MTFIKWNKKKNLWTKTESTTKSKLNQLKRSVNLKCHLKAIQEYSTTWDYHEQEIKVKVLVVQFYE